MTDGAPERTADVFQRYVGSAVRTSSEARPCRDPDLLGRAARCAPRPAGAAFSLFGQAATEAAARTTAGRAAHLRSLIKASELLETVCLNLFLQPWNRNIRTLKTFTGPFVYFLQSVLSGPNIQSLFASIGYLLHTDDSHSEYRLSEDADPDRAMLMGFELLLVRVECCHLLEILEQDPPGPQDWLKILQRVGFTKSEEAKDDETEGQQEENGRKEVPLCLEAKHVGKPQPRTQHRLFNEDQSIMEMQRTYPDLVIRGRPLLREQPATGISRRRIAVTASSNNDDNKEFVSPVTATTSICGESDGSKAGEGSKAGDGSKADECSKAGEGRTRRISHHSNVGAAGQRKAMTSFRSSSDGSRAEDDLSGPQAFSLHITIKAGSRAETGDVAAWTQDGAAQQSKNLVQPEDLSTVAEEPVEMMDQVQVNECKEAMKTKDGNKSSDNMNKEKLKQRMTRKNREVEVQNLMMSALVTDPELSAGTLNHGAGRTTGSSQGDPGEVKEAEQSVLCHASLLSVSVEDGTGGQEAERRVTRVQRPETGGQGDEEQLAHSYIIVEHNNK